MWAGFFGFTRWFDTHVESVIATRYVISEPRNSPCERRAQQSYSCRGHVEYFMLFFSSKERGYGGIYA